MKIDVCDICDREFPAGSLTAWDGDVCDECDAAHAADCDVIAACHEPTGTLPDGRLDINTPPG
jgi:hypothetical protein